MQQQNKHTVKGDAAMTDPLEQEFAYYKAHQDELVEKYRGKVVVIKGDLVIGVYDNELEAVNETSKEHKLGTFLVQKCVPGPEAYSQTYHSRVALVY